MPTGDVDERDHSDLLRQARDRAAKLAADLRRQRDELADSNPPSVPPESIAAGRDATDRLLTSVERLLSSIHLSTTPDPE